MLYRSIIFLVVLLCVPRIARCESGLTVKEAAIRALAANHLIKSASFRHDAAESAVYRERSRYLPRLIFEESVAYANLPTRVFMMKLDEARFTSQDFQIENLNHPHARLDFRTSLLLDIPLFDRGIGREVDLARKDAEFSAAGLAQQREDIVFQVYAAYLEVLKAVEQVRLTTFTVNDTREHLRLAQVRNQAGVGLKSDELRGRTFLAEMEEQSISAEHALILARLKLILAIGDGEGTAVEISGQPAELPVAMGLNELVQCAMERRSDLKGSEKVREKADAALALAKTAYYPTIYANAAYQQTDRDIPLGRDGDGWQAGVSFRWEIFDGIRRHHDTARAEALRLSSVESVHSKRQEILYEVTEAFLHRQEADKRRQVARGSVQTAEEGVRLVSKRYENSLATVVELLDAQTALNRARTGLTDDESVYALATVRLYHAAGILLQEVLR